MHPAMIQAALKMRGISQVDIAEQCGGVSPTTVYQVVHAKGRSKRIERYIAAVTGISLPELWPQWHGPAAKRALRKSLPSSKISELLRAVG